MLKTSNQDCMSIQNIPTHVLSSAQKRMLILHEYTPTSTTYIETIAMTTQNNINAKEIFRRILTLHPYLNTEIEMLPERNEYLGRINIGRTREVIVEKVEEGQNITDYIAKSIQPMQILSSPLVICRHLRMSTLSILVLHIHHIIADDITFRHVAVNLSRLLTQENIYNYSAWHTYSTFVVAEGRYLDSSNFISDEAFWTQKLQTLPPQVNLSFKPLSESIWDPTIAYRAKHKYKIIPAPNAKSILKMNEELEISHMLYYLVLTSIVLQRYLGVDDMVIAIPTSLRDDENTKSDGLFVNTLLFRVNINYQLTLGEYIKNMAAEWQVAQKHKYYSLDLLAQWVWKTHQRSIDSFCSFMYNFSEMNRMKDEIDVFSKHAKMPFNICFQYNMLKNETGILFHWAEDLLDEGIVDRMSDAVIKMCSTNIALDQKITDLQILPESEIQLLQSFTTGNNSDSFFMLEDERMNVKFENHVNIDPTQTAIIFEEEKITYGSLNQMASQIAKGLRERVNIDKMTSDPVILYARKDINAVAMMIGIWKAGGYFLPMALSNRNVLKDVSVRMSVAAILFHCDEEDYQALIYAKFAIPMISLETLLGSSWNIFPLSPSMAPNDCSYPAYAIRTSGSTGIPKVCRISHHNLNVICRAWKAAYNMDEFQVNVFQWAPLSFDVFVGDVIRALVCVQGRLVICPDEKRLDVLYIQNTIRMQNITFLEITPQFALHLLENASREHFESLNILVLGSDVAHRQVFAEVRQFLRPDQRLINSYGLTEATIDSAYFEGHYLPITRSGTVPIGKPLPGVLLYVCDNNTLLSTPLGTIGELYIGGDVIASGDVELVTLRQDRGLTLKTGDICSWLPSGDLEHHGRSNDVVKLRGFRISTLEIERQILQQFPNAREACVEIMSDEGRGKLQYLCAFLELREDSKTCTDSNIVKEKLSRTLPYYMVPDVVYICDNLPLTSHGKLDRKSLPLLSDILEYGIASLSFEENEESETAMILKSLLGEAMDIKDTSVININATFIHIGCHSLILLRFCSLITQKTAFNVKIADLFRYPSISSLADYIEQTYMKG